MKITTRVALKVARLVSKIDIKIADPTKDAYEIGVDVILQVINKAGECEEEIVEILAALTGMPREEVLDADLIELFEKESKEGGALSFLLSAVKSKLNE